MRPDRSFAPRTLILRVIARIAGAAIVALGLIASSSSLVIAQQPTAGGATSSQAQAQSPVFEGTAAVSGVVTDATTKEPIPGVMVYLGFQGRGAVGRLSRQITDAKGRFVFTDLPAGTLFFINATKLGYLEGHFGSGAGGLLGGLIAVADGQWVRDANVVMSRPGSISGTVVDERGEPAVGVFVRVLARVRVAGRMTLAAGQTSKTDDRGVYRLADLSPGRYIVQVPSVQQSFPSSLTPAEIAGLRADQVTQGRSVPEAPPALDMPNGSRVVVGSYLTPPAPVNGRPMTYPPAFHPGVSTIGAAAVIDLRANEDRDAVNVALHPVPAGSVSGIVEGPPESVAGSVLRLIPDGLEDLGFGGEAATSVVGADGRFLFVNVPVGGYTIDLRNSITEVTYRAPLATLPVALPAAPGTSAGGASSGSISSGPYGTGYSVKQTNRTDPTYARQRVSVEARPVTNLVVTLRRGSTIRGKFAMDTGEAPPATFGSGSVYAEPADANPASGVVPSNPRPITPNAGPQVADEFVIAGIGPGQFLLRFISLPANGVLMSVMGDDGIDHRLKPFDTTTGRDYNVVVTVTTKRIELTGAVDMQGTSTRNAVVIAFPVDRTLWTNYGLTGSRARSTPTTSAGTYRLQSLSAGDYHLAAVSPDQADVANDPDMLAKLAPLATRLTVTWGDVKTQNLSLVRVR